MARGSSTLQLAGAVRERLTEAARPGSTTTAPVSAMTPRDRTLTAAALVLVLATVLAGVVAAGVTLGSTGSSTEARAAGQTLGEGLAGVDVGTPGVLGTAVGAWFVGILVALLPGCLAAMLLAVSPALTARQKLVCALLPVLAITLMAALPALVVDLGAPGWLTTVVVVLVGLGVVVAGAFLVRTVWGHVAAVPVVRPVGAPAEDALGTVGPDDTTQPTTTPPTTTQPTTSLRAHRHTPRAGAWANLLAAAALIAGTIALVRSAAFLPPVSVNPADSTATAVIDAALPAWYTLGSGFAATAFLWAPLWLLGAALLQVSTRATRAASRLAWVFVPLLAFAATVGVVLARVLGALGTPDGLARVLGIALVLAGAAAVGLWARRVAPAGLRELTRLLHTRGQGLPAHEESPPGT